MKRIFDRYSDTRTAVSIPGDGAVGDVGRDLHEFVGVECHLLWLVDVGQHLPVDVASRLFHFQQDIVDALHGGL